ncbi:MAG: hypothetical protein H0U45_16795 [Tatlockia sp.]|nr:hypothetical protein [Tatlockia sp.]
MPSFIAQIQALDTAIAQNTRSLKQKTSDDVVSASKSLRSPTVSNNLVKSN